MFLNTTPAMSQNAGAMYIWKAVQVILKCRLSPWSDISHSGIKINSMCVHCKLCQTSRHTQDPASTSILCVSLAVNSNVSVVIPCIKDSGMKYSVWDSEREYKSLTDFSFIDVPRLVDFQKQSAKCWLKAMGLLGLRKVLGLDSSQESLACIWCGSALTSHSQRQHGKGDWLSGFRASPNLLGLFQNFALGWLSSQLSMQESIKMVYFSRVQEWRRWMTCSQWCI